MKLEPVENPFGHFAAALEIEPGTRVFFLNGEPVGYLEAGELRLSASLSTVTFREAFPADADRAGKAACVPEREVAAILLFRDRAFNRMLHEAFARMPFGSEANFDLTPAQALDFGQIASNVEALRVALQAVTIRNARRDSELAEHRKAVEGVALLLRLAGMRDGEDEP